MRKQIQNIGIVHVHLAYMELRTMFASLSEILSLAWRNEDGSNSNLVGKVKDELKATLNQMNVSEPMGRSPVVFYRHQVTKVSL